MSSLFYVISLIIFSIYVIFAEGKPSDEHIRFMILYFMTIAIYYKVDKS